MYCFVFHWFIVWLTYIGYTYNIFIYLYAYFSTSFITSLDNMRLNFMLYYKYLTGTAKKSDSVLHENERRRRKKIKI